MLGSRPLRDASLRSPTPPARSGAASSGCPCARRLRLRECSARARCATRACTPHCDVGPPSTMRGWPSASSTPPTGTSAARSTRSRCSTTRPGPSTGSSRSRRTSAPTRSSSPATSTTARSRPPRRSSSSTTCSPASPSSASPSSPSPATTTRPSGSRSAPGCSRRRGVHLRGALARAARAHRDRRARGSSTRSRSSSPRSCAGSEGDEELRGHAAATERVVSPASAPTPRRARSPPCSSRTRSCRARRRRPTASAPSSSAPPGAVPPETVAGFDYVALGHLHAPQDVAPGVRYSGSLLKYSFARGGAREGRRPRRGGARPRHAADVPARRAARRRAAAGHARRPAPAPRPRKRTSSDLVEVTLDDEGYVLDAKRKLGARFPHVLSVVRKDARRGRRAQGTFGQQVAGAGGDDLKLFESFFKRRDRRPPRPRAPPGLRRRARGDRARGARGVTARGPAAP